MGEALILLIVVGVIAIVRSRRQEIVPSQDKPLIVYEPAGGREEDQVAGLKRCPFCAEQIQRDAVVCRYCGRDLGRDLRRERTAASFKGIPRLVIFFVLVAFIGVGKLIGNNPSSRERPTSTEIALSEYRDKCHKGGFDSVCKGKFVKFDGVVSSVGEKEVRVRTAAHGFDVSLASPADKSLVGSKVTFSGYLMEDHTMNDDVDRGSIDAVVQTAEQVKAEEKARKEQVKAEDEARETANPTCEKTWKACLDNEELINKNQNRFKVKTDCRRAADDAARYGDTKWGWVPFGKFNGGADYPKTGIVTVIDDEVQFQNGFGAYVRSIAVCTYDLNQKKVTKFSVMPK